MIAENKGVDNMRIDMTMSGNFNDKIFGFLVEYKFINGTKSSGRGVVKCINFPLQALQFATFDLMDIHYKYKKIYFNVCCNDVKGGMNWKNFVGLSIRLSIKFLQLAK